ncbi:UPF0149 family protein [Aquabacterium sp.]|uniref:UPF0149 family protein n=1 Tax=Aquabacterium sp. TaxID=1872578 RepID=UPI002488E0E5|nr:UPF0149 family protein [Aquabacterium sp.]MDI1260528.1 UPF0149 family protein [Aquabacterium sp.]
MTTPSTQPTNKPNTAPPLSDADINELDDLLAAVPAPLEAVDAVMLDGYLCGILVQPVLLTPEQWLPPIFGETGQVPAPTEGWTAAQNTRLLALIERRREEILRGILENSWFDPIVPQLEDDDGKLLTGKDAMEGLGYWVAGFEWALANFPQLEDLGSAAVPDVLESLWRHLPEQDETQAEMTKALDQEHPLRNLDEGIQQLVFDVVDLAEVGVAERIKVTTVKHETPKLGRNDPCHCGSGKKFKQCHGAT